MSELRAKSVDWRNSLIWVVQVELLEHGELVIQRTPLIVGYTVNDNVVWILRILRGAKQWLVKMPLPE